MQQIPSQNFDRPTVGALQSVEVNGERSSECLRPASLFYLRQGIYKMRVMLRGVPSRILSFFHWAMAAVISHCIVKDGELPPKEMDRAVEAGDRIRGYD